MIASALNAIKELGNAIKTSQRFVEEDVTTTRILSDLNSSYISQKREGLKKVICMMQRMVACSEYYSHVLKISDTRDPFLKRLIGYYFHCYNCLVHKYASLSSKNASGLSPERRLEQDVFYQCTNTLLKDLNDKNRELRNSALEFLVRAGRRGAFQDFTRKIRKIIQSECFDNRIRAILLIERLSVGDDRLLERSDFFADILNAARLGSFQMQVCALRCISRSETMFIKNEEIIGFLDRVVCAHNNKLYYCGIEVFTRMLIRSRGRLNENETELALGKLRAMLSVDLYTAFCAADTIMKMSDGLMQYVFEKMCMFMHCRDEELFHLLTFLFEIIQEHPDLIYENRIFAVFDDDNTYIKRIKFDILTYRPDNFSVSEIMNLSRYPEFKTDALRFCFEREIPERALFKECLALSEREVEKALHYCRPQSELWREILVSEYNPPILRKESAFIVSSYHPSVPENPDLSLLCGDDPLRFYTSFYLRGVIGKEFLRSCFKKLSLGNAAAKERSKALLKLVEEDNTRALNKYSRPRMTFFVRTRNPVTSAAEKNKSNFWSTARIEKMRPFAQQNTSVPTPLDGIDLSKNSLASVGIQGSDFGPRMHGFSEGTKDPAQNREPAAGMLLKKEDKAAYRYCLEEAKTGEPRDDGVRRYIVLKAITNIWFTGKVILRGQEVFLRTESVTRPFRVCSRKIDSDEEILISDVSERCIGKVRTPQHFSIKVNNLYGYSVGINCKICIVPLQCDLLGFNDMFNKIDDYVMLQKAFMLGANVHAIDRLSFSFEMLGIPFFGKVVGDSVVLKSKDKSLLSAISREFN